MPRLIVLLSLLALHVAPALAQSVAPPALVYGRFVDDYGSRYEITTATWRQGAHAEYRIAKWNVAGQYLIAQNAETNPSDPRLWTRIDWMKLDGMAPYTWAYCYAAYKAPTAEAAESVSIAHRTTPKTGCNGFPFSRMKPVIPDPAHDTLPAGGVPASTTVVYAMIAGELGDTAGIDPIVAVTIDDRLIQPPVPYDDSLTAATRGFQIDFYRPGTPVHLLAGGSAIGTTAVTGLGEFQCVDLSATVRGNPAIRHAPLAVNTLRFIDAQSHRRIMTPIERRQAIALLQRAARDSGARADSQFNAHVVSIDRSGKRFLLLDGTAKRDSTTFDIAIIAGWTDAAWSPELTVISGSTDEDGKDRSLITFLDVLRLGNRSALDVFAEASSYEDTGYVIYRRIGASWVRVYEHAAGGC